jgi:hypothetical protein
LAEQPGFADAHLGRSWALVRLGRFTEASRALDRAELLGANRAALANQRRWLRAEQSKASATRPRDATTP